MKITFTTTATEDLRFFGVQGSFHALSDTIVEKDGVFSFTVAEGRAGADQLIQWGSWLEAMASVDEEVDWKVEN